MPIIKKARVSGIERINRYPQHNKDIMKTVLNVEPKRGKFAATIRTINEMSYSIIMQETAAKYTVSDFFEKSEEVFKFITTKRLDFLSGDIKNRGKGIQIGKDGFFGYEGINRNFLVKHKDIIIHKLDELDLVNHI